MTELKITEQVNDSPTCSTCKYLRRVSGNTVCGFNPPQVTETEHGPHAFWPNVSPDLDWCGQHTENILTEGTANDG